MATGTSQPSPYAPIALRDELWWQIGRRAALRGDVGADGSADDDAVQKDMLRLFYTPELVDLLESPTPSKKARDAHELFAGAMELAPVIGQYELHGRQIFDLSSGLVQMLQHTDIRDCSFQNLQLPYPALYLHFGRQAGIKIKGLEGDTEYVDGALIAHARDEKMQILRFALACLDESGARVKRPLHYLSIGEYAMRLPVHQAIDAAVDYFNDGSSPHAGEWMSELWSEMRRCAADAAVAALPLIVNGLFYLENPPRPHRTALGAATPQELVAQWERTPLSRRRKLQSKLNAEGYTLVHLVGEEIASSAEGVSGGTVAPHWRRGHWREQAHGPRLSLRKRILIKPMLVNGREVADPLQVPGHVYKPSADEGQGPSP